MDVNRDEIIAAARERVRNRQSLPSPAARRAIREAAGLTRAEMGLLVETNAWNVVAWELGRADPRGDRLARYVAILKQISGTTEL